ncbi:hypothetical protein AJ79_04154 [Helicocarpus griseus UAMH5409]|uniref:Uncharacterized protein n=1 Tax=Helicocarpus griseus UAMH5409 TaxID=1447875 RepID=A0A2B7XTX3_9EURO|nr:hypothetical protein AJ79_04154 [Helicocarpus griseus UAMH5409]
MKPLLAVLLPPLLLVHSTLCAPVSSAPSLLSRTNILEAESDQDSFVIPPYQSEQSEAFTLGERPLSSNSPQHGPSTRQLKLLRHLDLNYVSPKELRGIAVWLRQKWPSSKDLIHSIQELLDIEKSDFKPSSTQYEKPLPSTFLMQLGDIAGSRTNKFNFPGEYSLQEPLRQKLPKLPNLPVGVLAHFDIKSSPLNPSDPTSTTSSPSGSPSKPTSSPTVETTDLFTMVCTMDILDALIIWTSGRPVWTALLAITALIFLFLLSVLIVEVYDFVWTFAIARFSVRCPNCSRRRGVRLTGPERQLVAVPMDEDEDEDEERKEMYVDLEGDYEDYEDEKEEC